MSLSTSVCLSLLLSGGTNLSPLSTAEETAVTEWLQIRDVSAPSIAQVTATAEQWRVWNQTTAAARNANLALELKNVLPPPEDTVVSLDGRTSLENLSAQNLARLQRELEIRIRLKREPAVSERVQIQSVSHDLDFRYMVRRERLTETGVHEPLVSSRELKKIGADARPAFFSSLLGGSATVAARVTAVRGANSAVWLNAQIPFHAFLLNSDLAEREGFVVPDFRDATALLQFFGDWEPETLAKLVERNRMSLPTRISDGEKLLAYLDPVRTQAIFPDHEAYERLAPLRERLHRYVLTEPDARALLKWVFERWLTSVAVRDQREFGRILADFRRDTGPYSVFAHQFLPQIGLPDLSLRIPVAVGPQNYSVLRLDSASVKPRVWDSRRLDHESKP